MVGNIDYYYILHFCQAVRIRNFGDLASGRKRRDSLGILEAGLAAADPAGMIPRYATPGAIRAGGTEVRLGGRPAIYSVAFGKAADSMTRALNGTVQLDGGIIVMPRGARSVLRGKKFKTFNSAHPIPDKESVRAAKEVVKFLQARKAGELVVFLVSGGASALVALPDRITLDDKVRVSELLLKSGAAIQEINCVRKHLSKVKGGKLLGGMKCDGVALVMSDVQGDDLSAIASGMTYWDDTTPRDALAVIEERGLAKKVPREALDVLRAGPEHGSPACPNIPHAIIASNALCLDAMAGVARAKGYGTETMQVYGDVKKAVPEILARFPQGERQCLIFGGEVTTKVLGKGKGGRNQELVLRLLKNAQGLRRVAISSMGTDGIDGNSVYAGAITENVGADTGTIKGFLKESDSARYFEKRRANILTGPTHTNLQDIGVILS